MNSADHPDIENLRRIRSLCEFTDEQLSALSKKLTVETARPRQRLIEFGYAEHYSFYLIQGEILITAPDGVEKRQVASPHDQLNPFAQIRPSLYSVDAVSDVRYIRISADELTSFAQHEEHMDFGIEVQTIDQSDEESSLAKVIFQDMMKGSLSLPTLPDVAFRIQKAFTNEQSSVVNICKVLQTDAAITAKLIRTANSSLYGGVVKFETLNLAVVRLGLETTRKLVTLYAVKELFREMSSEMKVQMQNLWMHSQKVASLSKILAKKLGGFDPELAQLAGLVHDLGEIAILQYGQEHAELCADEEQFMHIVSNLRPQITSILLQQWNFGEDFITVGAESEEWFRNPSEEADLCDLILIAQYHSYIGTDAMRNLPPISKLPAFVKVGMGDLTTPQIIEFMKESKTEMDEIGNFLAEI